MQEFSIKLYAAKDIAELFHCSESRSYKLMNMREFPSFRVGKRLYTRSDELEKFIKQKCKNNVRIKIMFDWEDCYNE